MDLGNSSPAAQRATHSKVKPTVSQARLSCRRKISQQVNTGGGPFCSGVIPTDSW